MEFILLVIKVFLTPFKMMQWRQKWFKNSETLKEMVTISYRAYGLSYILNWYLDSDLY